MTLQILTATAMLALLIHVRPPVASEPLYRPREFPAPAAPDTGAETLHDAMSAVPEAVPQPADLDDLWHLRMTTGEYARLEQRIHAEAVVQLDAIEDTMRQGLADLEAFALTWLAADLDAEHALLSIAAADVAAPALERAAARLSDVDTAVWVAGVLA